MPLAGWCLAFGNHCELMQGPEREIPRQRVRTRMFETRSHSWREAGLLREINPHAVRRARVATLLLAPLFIGIVVLYHHLKAIGVKPRSEIEVPIQIATVVTLMILGWVIAREAGRAFGPILFRRLEPATAGTVGFLIRLVTVLIALLVALSLAGVKAQTLALGGALTAVVVGLAAQQTFGNVIAGTVLLSARPFRVGERVRLQGGALAGQVDGVVSSLGLLYTTFVAGEESIMVPNSVVLSVMVIVGEERFGLSGWPGSGKRQRAEAEQVEPAGATTSPPPASARAVGASAPPPPPQAPSR